MNVGTIIFMIVNCWLLTLVIGKLFITLDFEFCDANFLMVLYIIFVCGFMGIYAYIDQKTPKGEKQ